MTAYLAFELMNSITIQLPHPEPELSPNSRCHWRKHRVAVKAARTRSQSEACRVMRCKRPEYDNARIRIDWYHKTRNWPDRDNIIAWCKSYIDGIAGAGILANDRGVTYEPVGRFKDAKNPRVEICITCDEEPEDED